MTEVATLRLVQGRQQYLQRCRKILNNAHALATTNPSEKLFSVRWCQKGAKSSRTGGVHVWQSTEMKGALSYARIYRRAAHVLLASAITPERRGRDGQMDGTHLHHPPTTDECHRNDELVGKADRKQHGEGD